MFIFKQKTMGSFCLLPLFWPLKLHANRTVKQLCVHRKTKNFFLIKTWNFPAGIWLRHLELKDATEHHEICINILGRDDTELKEGMMEWELME